MRYVFFFIETENQLDHLKGVAKIKKTLLDEHDPSIPPISNGDEAIFIFTAFAINYVDLVRQILQLIKEKINFNLICSLIISLIHCFLNLVFLFFSF